MDEMGKHGQVGLAAMRAGMHRNTGRRYVEADRLPSELKSPRTWRTRTGHHSSPRIISSFQTLDRARPSNCGLTPVSRLKPRPPLPTSSSTIGVFALKKHLAVRISPKDQH